VYSVNEDIIEYPALCVFWIMVDDID